MSNRINAGYIITDSIHIGNVEIVLGVHSRASSGFVTWECTGGSNYYWGHYFSSLIEAQRDFLDRAGRELEIQQVCEKEKQNRANREREDTR